MSRQFAGRYWKWVVSAGLAVGLFGVCAPAGADDEKEVEVKVIKKDGDDARKEEVRNDEEGEVRKGQGKGHNDARIDELAGLVKQLAGQVHELREEVRSLRTGGVTFGNPEEMKKRMEEIRKKFPGGAPEGLDTDKFRAEFEKRFRAEQEKLAGQGANPEKIRAEFEKRFRAETEKLGGARAGVGGDVEAQIRRQIEQLQNELKRIAAAKEAKEKEGDKKREDKEEAEEAEEREAKERAAKREAEEREDKESEEKKEDK